MSQGLSLDVSESALQESDGLTVLMRAARDGDIQTIEAADGNDPTLDMVDRRGYTALAIAVAAGQRAVADRLVRAGARTRPTHTGEIDPHTFATRPEMRRVLAAGAANGTLAGEFYYERRNFDLVRFEKDLVAAATPDARGLNGKTALMVAINAGNQAAAGRLLESGANPNANDSDGVSPLSYALMAGDVEIANDLVRAGGVINADDVRMRTPLMFAVDGGTNAVEFALDHGADIHAVDVEGRTAALIAARANDLTVLALLLERGALVSLPGAVSLLDESRDVSDSTPWLYNPETRQMIEAHSTMRLICSIAGVSRSGAPRSS